MLSQGSFQYGVGLVDHGQNVTLTLEDNQPVGCIIKDFHGDLRLVDEELPELDSLDGAIKQNLTRLPAKYLVHVVTVLRFVSPWLESNGLEHQGISEAEFYGLLANEILRYQAEHSHLAPRFEAFNLLSEHIDKVCLNRVKFKIGYGESNQRPLPELGEPIRNPLVIGLEK
ncbi:IucA/IucC family C-terminal-domain containing protein [Vibrio sp. CB1-14]|uniref:IucA/IucC family C-terminal-domain containing protein n=1 Tax=Vibrio chaetopteri TaxID=3016528 RepID=A0AAU8BS10_9VIBR